MADKLNRVIKIVGEITDEGYLAFTRRLTQLEREGNKPVELEIISEGGDAYTALAYCDRMRNSPLEIHVKAFGLVASAAVLILAAGDKRSMGPHAWVMVHEDSGELVGNVTALEKAAKHMRRLETQWSCILGSLTKTSAAQWMHLHSDEQFLSAQQCLELGLVDEIL